MTGYWILRPEDINEVEVEALHLKQKRVMKEQR